MAKRNGTKTVAVAVVDSLASLVALAKTVTAANFADTLASVNRDHGVIHGARNVARFNGWRVQYAQNTTLAQNAEWQLDDVQLLFVWRALHPVAVGKLYAGSIADGIAIVRGVRADYNRTGHGMPTGKPATESVSYGARRFDVPAVTAGNVPRIETVSVTPIPANPVMVEPKRRTARKRTAA